MKLLLENSRGTGNYFTWGMEDAWKSCITGMVEALEDSAGKAGRLESNNRKFWSPGERNCWKLDALKVPLVFDRMGRIIEEKATHMEIIKSGLLQSTAGKMLETVLEKPERLEL